MPPKEPVLLTLLIDTGQLRWYVAGIRLDGTASPLICSQPGNLCACRGIPLDEQVTFLRHRLSGALQRGCDRLWERGQKPCQIVFVVDGPFLDTDPSLNRNVADHFVAWMANPPVVYFMCCAGFACDRPVSLDLVAGELDPALRSLLDAGLPKLFVTMRQPDAWEFAPSKTGNSAETQ